MPDVLADARAMELILTTIVATLIALLSRRGPSYWPAIRVLALVMGIRGVYWILLRILYWQQSAEHYIAIAQQPLWQGLYYALELGGLLWVLWIVVRTNRSGHPVDLLGRDDE